MEAFIFFHQHVSEHTAGQLEARAIDLVNRGFESLTVILNSGGGNTFAGLGAFHLLRSLPIEVNTHAHGVCASIAASIYLAGKRRTVAPASAFVLHATTFSEGPLAGEQTEFNRAVAEPYRSIAGWGDDLVQRFLSPGENHLWPAEAVELGFAHEVVDLKIPHGAEIHHIV
ncbi:ATP-dependent Clp protease proteolytic subunit [Pseudomonas alabamensis]|uniref:ATP-dependent Clp protease proteolytic subunit n=1 Tax=Pseudomonas alabamensis TaxID=3064349 RepID=UPI003F64BF53